MAKRTGTKPQSLNYTTRGAGLPEVGPRVPTVRQAGHFVDQKLKYNDALRPQLDLFDQLNPELKEVVATYQIRAQGIQLSPGEERLVSAIYSLLKEKSESKNSSSDQFYTGNHEAGSINHAGVLTKKVAIRVRPAELYKSYLGSDNYSGRDMKDIDALLETLENKRFYMKYDRHRQTDQGRRTDRIEVAQRLIQVMKYSESLTDEQLEELDREGGKRGELIIMLHPILTDQIDSKYIEYPLDMNQRMITAAGGPRKVTVSAVRLRDYMLRELSAGRSKAEINDEKLPFILGLDNYVFAGRKKLLKETIDHAIDVCKKLGLVLEHEEVTGAEGQKKHVFKLNKEFHNQ